MMQPLQEIFIVLGVAYLIGSVPAGLFVGRIFSGSDIRTQGSGNIGATNVSRVAGFFPAGMLTLLLDIGKGALPVWLITYEPSAALISDWAELSGNFSKTAAWMVGLAAVFGHCFSPWLRFHGGKGVATSFGVFLVLSPMSAAIGAVTFVSVFLHARTGSLASLSGAVLSMISLAALGRDPANLLPALGILYVIILRHEKNIDSLLEGKENAFR